MKRHKGTENKREIKLEASEPDSFHHNHDRTSMTFGINSSKGLVSGPTLRNVLTQPHRMREDPRESGLVRGGAAPGSERTPSFSQQQHNRNPEFSEAGAPLKAPGACYLPAGADKRILSRRHGPAPDRDSLRSLTWKFSLPVRHGSAA